MMVGYFLLFTGCVGGYIYFRKKKEWKYARSFLRMSLLGLVCLGTAVWEQVQGTQENAVYQLQRNEAGAGEREEQLYLHAEGLFDGYAYPIRISEHQLTEQEAAQLLEKAKQELEQALQGKHSSLEEISGDLNIPGSLQEGQVEVYCTFEPYEFIEADGRVLWDKVKGNTLVKVSAQLECGAWQVEHEFFIRLVPPVLEEKQELLKAVREIIAAANPQEEYVTLPLEVNGIPLQWSRAESGKDVQALVIGMALLLAWHLYGKEKEEQRKKVREQQLKLDYPDIVGQLSLLAGAGMTISTAWARLAKEYRKNLETKSGELRPGYEELLKTWYEMQDGVGEIQAYENFGKRCGLSQYRKFASLLMQNARKGTKGLQQILDSEAAEAFMERKVYARKLGEEAGIRLLAPMGIMLVLVFVILLMPAMLTLNIGL